MRESLFRGKRTDNGEWVEGIPVFFNSSTCKIIADEAWGYDYKNDGETNVIYCEAYDVDPNTIGQCTGVYDVNGNKIFVGDIIQTINELEDRTTNCIVKWDKLELTYKAEHIAEEWERPLSALRGYITGIVGNIHDQPTPPSTDEINAAIRCFRAVIDRSGGTENQRIEKTALWALGQEKERRKKEEKSEKIDK